MVRDNLLGVHTSVYWQCMSYANTAETCNTISCASKIFTAARAPIALQTLPFTVEAIFCVIEKWTAVQLWQSTLSVCSHPQILLFLSWEASYMANQLSVTFGVVWVFFGVFKHFPALVLQVLRLLLGTLHFLLLTPFWVLSNQKWENYFFSLYKKYNPYYSKT